MKIAIIIKSFVFLMCTALFGCEDYLEPDLSPDKLANEDVFLNEETAISAVNGIYTDLFISSDPTSITNGSLSVLGGLCADELYDFTQSYLAYNVNDIPANAFGPGYYYWRWGYETVYSTNAVLEGVENSSLSQDFKDQIKGEAYFIRAFLHFYLLNIYGNIPLITTTDYSVNAAKGQAAPSEVYEQIIDDLKQAENLLSTAYPSGEKLRANKYVAQALLARVYLYLNDWENAIAYASKVIEGPYGIETDIDKVFSIADREAIWQLMPANQNSLGVNEARWFTPGETPTYVFTDEFLSSFEAGDARAANWIDTVEYEGASYYYPVKYLPPDASVGEVTQYSTILRLAEQYLIRAEANAQLENLPEAVADLDQIRVNHGNIGQYSGTVSKEAVLDAIMQERRVEFFAEWGHRWFDLIRSGKADEVLGSLKPDTWESTDVLWPIPTQELEANPRLRPNDGYQ